MKTKDTVGIRRLKNQVSRILDDVRERGADYVVTKRGRPVAVIRPWRSEDARAEQEIQVRANLDRLAEIAGRVRVAAENRVATEGAAGAVSKQRR